MFRSFTRMQARPAPENLRGAPRLTLKSVRARLEATVKSRVSRIIRTSATARAFGLARLLESRDFFCVFCQETHSTVEPQAVPCFRLTGCGHYFCLDGLVAFVRTAVRDGRAFPKCCALVARVPQLPGLRVSRSFLRGSSADEPQCGTAIAESDVVFLLSAKECDAGLLARYARLRAARTQPLLRECPRCTLQQVSLLL